MIRRNKVIKISSNQGGNFTTTNNLCDFDIPADGNYSAEETQTVVASINAGTTTAEEVAAISNEAYTSVPLTIMSVIFSDLLEEASFLLIAKLPEVSIDAINAS